MGRLSHTGLCCLSAVFSNVAVHRYGALSCFNWFGLVVASAVLNM